MAVITVSKIQIRSGLQEDLPVLDTGEFGWCVDTQRLFIGKGSLQEGAPITGVTEVLTEYSVNSILGDINTLQGNIANLESYVSSITPTVANIIPKTEQIIDGQSAIVNIANVAIDSLSTRVIDYSITRGTTMRVGTIKVSNMSGTIAFDDDYNETADTGVTLYFTSNAGVAVLGYTSSTITTNGTFTYIYSDLRS